MNLTVYKGEAILGATIEAEAINFGIFSKNATQVILEIYINKNDPDPVFSYTLNSEHNKTGNIWHVKVSGMGYGVYYGWRMDGSSDLSQGHRFNIEKLLVDPYSKAVGLDLEGISYKSFVVDDRNYNWEGDKPPDVPMEDTIIYEIHVRLFTQSPTSDVVNKGTFKGIIEKLDHLKELGVTTLELLPIYDFNMNGNNNINPLTGEKLKDIWGYNPNHFFAVSKHYTGAQQDGDEIRCFKDFIKEIHKAGMEVILDVVYNHTGEGNEHGETINFKGIDNQVYYMLSQEDKTQYENYSGTGNTLNCNHPVVKNLILDSLRYWVTHMHVDGFRFDLASILGRDEKGQWGGNDSLLGEIAADPILSKTKLIAESWDAAGGYHLGEMPVGFAEWNGEYRDDIRRFINGRLGTISPLASRITGSANLFGKRGRGPLDSINFITAHDGFTMWDLVSYNDKHNLANGEDNRDGSNHNISYNYGVEGETDDPGIINLRKKQVKNAITLLMISQGVPMILMGDEFCRTQGGNNNPYCQDNEIGWVDWQRKKQFSDIYQYFCKIINFRKKHRNLRQTEFLSNTCSPRITWHGIKEDAPDWSYHSRTIAFRMSANLPDEEDLYVAINGHSEPLAFQLPEVNGGKWYRVVDTGEEAPNDFLEEPLEIKDKEYVVDAFSMMICICILS